MTKANNIYKGIKEMKRVTLVSATLAAASVFLPILGFPSAAATANHLSDGAESGSMSKWSNSENVNVMAPAARNDGYGFRVDATKTSGYMQWSSAAIEQGLENASISTLVRVNSRDAADSVDLITLKHTGAANHFDFFLTHDTGKFKWDLLNTDFDEYEPAVLLGQWYLIEAKVFFGSSTYTASVRINGEDQGTISSSGQAQQTVKSLWFGTTNAKTHQQDYDDVQLKVSEAESEYLGPKPPVAAAACANSTLEGAVNPSGDTTTYHFEYGPTVAYGSSTPESAAGSGNTTVPVTAIVPYEDQALNYRLVATNLDLS